MSDATHPAHSTLRRFARVETSRRENREVVAHLLQGCRACSSFVLGALEPASADAETLLLASGAPISPSPLDFLLRDG